MHIICILCIVVTNMVYLDVILLPAHFHYIETIVDVNPDDTGEPLEYMSYFVDDYLIDLSDNQIDTTDFFRQYMAGFLISTRETALTVCRSDDTNFVNDAMCQMIQATKTVQDKPAFTDTLLRQQYQNATNCTKRETQNTPVLSYLNAVDCAFEDYTIC